MKIFYLALHLMIFYDASRMNKLPKIENSTETKILNNKIYDNSIINFQFSNNIKGHIFVNCLL